MSWVYYLLQLEKPHTIGSYRVSVEVRDLGCGGMILGRAQGSKHPFGLGAVIK